MTMAWNTRFKKASAARKRDAAGDRPVGRVADADRIEARTLDPTPYLEAQGYTVKKDGKRHRRVLVGKDEQYRLTQKQNDVWLWCDLYGNEGGDLIDLVREIEGQSVTYSEAVHRLTGGPDTLAPRPAAASSKPRKPRKPPKVPPRSPAADEVGRDYLRKRGISSEVLEYAEACGMLSYADGGVFFVGRDADGVAQNITRRATDLADGIQKRDLAGSDKGYPPILPGSSAEVWIVEGGVDALARHDLHRRAGLEPPTVIVTSGASVLSWIDNPAVQAVLKGAGRIVLAEENERSEDATRRAGEGHAKQIARIEARIEVQVERWRPPAGCKDLAEHNEQQQDEQQRPVQGDRGDMGLGRPDHGSKGPAW